MIKPRRLQGEGLAIVLEECDGKYVVDLIVDLTGVKRELTEALAETGLPRIAAESVTLYEGTDIQDALVYYGAGERLVNAIITWRENETLRIRSNNRRERERVSNE